jgi:hypothetical protein
MDPTPAPYRTRVTLSINGWRNVPAFARLTLPLFETFRRAAGARRLDLNALATHRQFTTYSDWADEAAAQTYSRSPEHKAAVQGTYAGVVDEFLIAHGDATLHRLRCTACGTWTRPPQPAGQSAKCGAELSQRLLPEIDPRNRDGGAPVVVPDRPLPLSLRMLQPLTEAAAARTYFLLNLTPALWWALMILAPRAAVTRALTRTSVVFLGLGGFYTISLLRSIVAEAGLPNYAHLDTGPRRLFMSRSGLLAGWGHYLAFDLFVGIWIYRTGLAEQRSTRVPLALTFVAGPLGLTWFLLQRGLRDGRPYPFEK